MSIAAVDKRGRELEFEVGQKLRGHRFTHAEVQLVALLRYYRDISHREGFDVAERRVLDYFHRQIGGAMVPGARPEVI